MTEAHEVPSHPSQNPHPHLPQNRLWCLWPQGDRWGDPPCPPCRGVNWTQTAAPVCVCHFTKLTLNQLNRLYISYATSVTYELHQVRPLTCRNNKLFLLSPGKYIMKLSCLIMISYYRQILLPCLER